MIPLEVLPFSRTYTTKLALRLQIMITFLLQGFVSFVGPFPLLYVWFPMCGTFSPLPFFGRFPSSCLRAGTFRTPCFFVAFIYTTRDHTFALEGWAGNAN